jgi:hypothetical protein
VPGNIYYLQLEVSKGVEVPIWDEPVRVRIEVPYGPYLYKKIARKMGRVMSFIFR